MKPRVLLEMPSLFFSLCFPHKITMLIKFAAKKKKKILLEFWLGFIDSTDTF